jgi:hypothetical protein
MSLDTARASGSHECLRHDLNEIAGDSAFEIGA